MKKETAIKRIKCAINREPLIKTEKDKEKFFNLIWRDYELFNEEEGEYYTPSQNLDFAIAVWLRDGEQVIKDIIKESKDV